MSDKLLINQPLISRLFVFVMWVAVVMAITRLTQSVALLFTLRPKSSPGHERVDEHFDAPANDSANRKLQPYRMHQANGVAINIRSARRISHIVFLLSILHFCSAAVPTYDWNCNNAKLWGSTCVYLALQQLFTVTKFGLTSSMLIYMAASVLERRLDITIARGTVGRT